MLSLIVFFPFLFSWIFFLLPKKFLYKSAVAGSCLQLALALSLFFFFDPSTAQLQLVENFDLIPFLGVNYFLAVDGLSFWYIILSSFLLPLVVLFSRQNTSPLYFLLLFTLVTLSQGAFLSFDGVLFYVFFEMSLLPLFFMIFLWGGEKKVYASFKFLIYTFFASLFLLGGLIVLMLMNKSATGQLSASLQDFYLLDFVFIQNQPLSTQSLLFFCFALAFLVKTPLAPFHTWLPLAHTEAPTGASVYLAAVILKLGTYGWFRFVLPLFPEASSYYAPLLLFLAVFGLIYTSLLAFAQTDIKKLIAYSSVAHMAFVILGVFAFNLYGLQGAFYQTLTHGISSAGLFLLAGVLYQRTKTRELSQYGGFSKAMPLLAILFFLITLSAIALPLTGSFVSEFLVLLGSYLSGEVWVWIAISGVVLTAIYMLHLFQKIFLFKPSSMAENLKDLNIREFMYLSPLALLGIVMGLFPNVFFKYSKASLEHLSQNQYNYTLSIYDKKPDSLLQNQIQKQNKLENLEKNQSSKDSNTFQAPSSNLKSKSSSYIKQPVFSQISVLKNQLNQPMKSKTKRFIKVFSLAQSEYSPLNLASVQFSKLKSCKNLLNKPSFLIKASPQIHLLSQKQMSLENKSPTQYLKLNPIKSKKQKSDRSSNQSQMKAENTKPNQKLILNQTKIKSQEKLSHKKSTKEDSWIRS